jgi:membrane fusion protein
VARPAFRDEVVAEQARAAMGAIVLVRPPSFALLTGATLALAAVAIAFLAVAEYSRKAPLAGSLVPESGAIRVVSPQPGLVRERFVREGEKVAAGETLVRVVDSRSTRDGGAVGTATVALASARIAEVRRQRDRTRAAAATEAGAIAARIAGLEAELAQLDAELESVEAREAMSRESLARSRELERRGFVSRAQGQQKEEEALEQRSRRHAVARARLAAGREIAGQRATLAESRSRAQAQLAALDAQVAALEQEQVERRALADAVVTAPAAGTVAAVLVEPGQVVAGGAGLLTLLPEGSPLQAHLFAPSRAVGFIRPGQEVRLRYPAFPFQKFGSHRARVVSVSRSALAPSELGLALPDASREPHYRVKVALESQSVTAYGRDEPLQAGMLVEADVLLDRRRLLEWVLEPLYGIAGRV